MLKTFSIGGVHPHENKLSAHQPIVQAEIPAKATILLSQHIGAPAKPIVAKGDVVKVGQRLPNPVASYQLLFIRLSAERSLRLTQLSMPADMPNPLSLLM